MLGCTCLDNVEYAVRLGCSFIVAIVVGCVVLFLGKSTPRVDVDKCRRNDLPPTRKLLPVLLEMRNFHQLLPLPSFTASPFFSSSSISCPSPSKTKDAARILRECFSHLNKSQPNQSEQLRYGSTPFLCCSYRSSPNQDIRCDPEGSRSIMPSCHAPRNTFSMGFCFTVCTPSLIL